jgi:hypothetical protein
MARANPQDRFAGGTGRGPVLELVTSDSDVVRRTYAAVMRRGAVRRALHAHGRDHQLDKAHSRAYAHDSALAKLRDQMTRCARAGATLEELLRIPELLYEHAFLLKGPARRTLDALDSEEARIDAEEDVVQMRRRIRGETPATNREEADLAARLATINTERSIALRARAEQLEPSGVCA